MSSDMFSVPVKGPHDDPGADVSTSRDEARSQAGTTAYRADSSLRNQEAHVHSRHKAKPKAKGKSKYTAETQPYK